MQRYDKLVKIAEEILEEGYQAKRGGECKWEKKQVG